MPTQVIAWVEAALDAIPTIAALGGDIEGWIASIKAMMAQAGNPTAAQWAALTAKIEADTAALQAQQQGQQPG